MTRSHRQPRDIGPEFSRHFAREMHRIARNVGLFERAERVQLECDRLLTIPDEETGHAVRSS